MTPVRTGGQDLLVLQHKETILEGESKGRELDSVEIIDL